MTSTPTRAIVASQKSARRRCHSRRILPTFIMPITATMTMAPRVASGRGSKSDVRKSATSAVAAAAVTREIGRARAGPVVGCRLRERRADGEAGEEAGARVRGPDRDQLPVGVDVTAMLCGRNRWPGRWPRRRRPARCRPRQRAGVAVRRDRRPAARAAPGPPAGRPRRGRPGLEPEGDRGGDRRQQHDERGREARQPTLQQQHRRRCRRGLRPA